MTSADLSKLAVQFAALVARTAADPRAPELRAELRKLGKKKRADDLVLSPGDHGALLLQGSALDAADSEEATAACALLAARLSVYGVEELTITPRAADADLHELIRLVAADPPGEDPVGHFAARASAVDARSIPRRLVKRASVPVEAPAEPPSAKPPTAQRDRSSKPTPRGTPSVAAPVVGTPPGAAPTDHPVESSSAPEPEPVSAENQRADRLTEALEVPETEDAELASLFARLQAAESPDQLTEPLDALAARIDLTFRQGKYLEVVQGMAGLVAIEHIQVEQDPSDDRRRAYARTFRALAKPLLLRQVAVMRHRKADDPTVARQAQAVLYRFGTDGAEALIDEYVSVPTAEARAICLDALRKIRRTHDALFALVRDTRDLVVRQAAGLLGELGDPRGEQMLIELIRHPDARARRAAVAALTRFETPGALDAIGIALDDESPIVRARAVAALERRGGPRAVPLLAPVLNREADLEVLYAAIAALGTIGGADAVAALIPCAQGESAHPRRRDAKFRIAACTALVAIRTPQSMAAVQALRDDRDREVRDAAVRLVAQASRRTTAMRAVATP